MIWILELGFWLWLFLGGFVCLGVVSHETDSPLLALASVVIFALGLQFLFGVPVWQAIWENPLWIAVLLIGYFSIGLGYSIFWKWRRYCQREAPNVARRFEQYKEQSTDEGGEEFLRSSYENGLHPANHKDRIIGWMLTWPFGVIWAVLNDPLTWIAREVYSLSAKTLKGISDAAIKSAMGGDK